MTNDSHKARLAALVQELSVIHEKVTLASGRESDFYVDMRRSTLHHEAAPLIGHVMLDLLEESGFAVGEEYVAVGGLTMGADPVATAMMHAAASRGLDLDAFVVRKAAKDHGMKRRIEGPDVVGKNVVVLEDTSTTGGSPLEAALTLREAGANVVAVAVIVDRATGAKERIEAEGFPYFYALGLEDIGLAGFSACIDEAGAGFCVNPAPASYLCARPHMWGTERMARAVTQRGASFMAPMATL